jgi:hypothetical protein
MKSWRTDVLDRSAAGLAWPGAPLTAAPSGHMHLVTAHDVHELRTALAKGKLPAEFKAKLAKLAEGNLSERYIEQNSQLFSALLLAALECSFLGATRAQREQLLRVLAYVNKEDDAIPDYLAGGFADDQQEVRAAAMELAPLLQQFKAWRLRHQVPAMWAA